MAIVRWDPFAELDTLHKQVNSLFNDTFGGAAAATAAPATDVYSDDKGLTIEAHLPNFREDEISVNQHEDALEIRAEHQEKEEKGQKKDRNYLVRESATQYYRRFAMPKNANIEKTEAKFDNGILKVHVPFKKLPAPKKIAIKAKNK